MPTQNFENPDGFSTRCSFLCKARAVVVTYSTEARQLLGYLRPHRSIVTGALAAMLLSEGLGLAFPYIGGRLLDTTVWCGEPANTDRIALLLTAILVLQAIFSFLHTYGFRAAAEGALAGLRQDLYRRVIRLPMSFHAGTRVGELASRMAADVAQIQDTLMVAIPQLLRQAIIFIAGAALIALTSARLALAMLVCLPLMVSVCVLCGRTMRRTARTSQDCLADSNVVIEETLHGIATVKAFTSERREEERYSSSLQAFRAATLRGARWSGMFVSFVGFAMFGTMVLVLWYGARLVQGGQLTAGQLASFLVYTLYVGSAMGAFAHLFGQLQRTLGATERIRELLREPLEDITPPGGVSLIGAPRRLRGALALEDVWFHYPSRPEAEVLRGINLQVEPGQRIALVGPSGSGKSTLVSLLLGFYRPQTGRMLLDGCDAQQLSLYDLRRHTAVVPQDVLLFGGTIAENIAYGRRDIEEDEIIAAAQRANAHEFICRFPDGYQTHVGERGTQLSGGQRQRIAIARAVLRDPVILVLDEATSALDSESETLVMQALESLMEGRTSLIIAHRLATVRSADCIYVIKGGQMVESGTHDELMARKGGLYRSLADLQFG